MTPRALLAGLVGLVCLVGADTAGAAAITLGAGRHPDVAIDEGNTAHVVWDSVDAGAPDRLFYCQIPRTAKACANTRTLTPPLEAIGQSTHVFAPGGGRIVIASKRCCGPEEGTVVLESGDNGATFGPPRLVGNYERAGDIAFGPGQSLLMASPAAVQRGALTGPAATTHAELEVGFSVPTYGAVATHNGTTPVFVHSDGDDTTYHVGDAAADLNMASNWAGPTVMPGGDEVFLESSPAGTQLLQKRGKPGKRYYGARKFDGAAFTPEVRVTEAADPREAGLGTTPFNGGSFYSAWIDNRTPDRLRWARSANGFNWSESEVVVGGSDAEDAFNIRVAGAPDGRAFAVWDENDNSGNARGVLLPAKGRGPPADAVRAAQYEFQLHAPFPCTPKGGALKMSVMPRTVKKVSKSKKAAVSSVRFTLDKTGEITDKTSKYTASFATADLPASSAHSLRAIVSYKVGGGKTKTATLAATGLICP